MNRKAIWILLPVLVLAVGVGLYATDRLPFLPGGEGSALADTSASGLEETDSKDKGDKDSKPEAPPVPVELALVEGRGISAYHRAASVIEADRIGHEVLEPGGRAHEAVRRRWPQLPVEEDVRLADATIRRRFFAEMNAYHRKHQS